MSVDLLRPDGAREIVDRARALGARLREDVYFGRLVRGDATADEYAAWLVQMHKYIRHTIRALHAHADSMAARAARDPKAVPARASARRHADEEDGHDDLLLRDLAALWSTSLDAARGRLEREAAAPSVADWERLSDVMIARYPAGMIGVALALETVATCLTDDMRRNLVARSGIANIENAVAFLAEHSGEAEADHTAGTLVRARALSSPSDSASIFFYGNAALTMFEGLVHFLAVRFSAELAPVG